MAPWGIGGLASLDKLVVGHMFLVGFGPIYARFRLPANSAGTGQRLTAAKKCAARPFELARCGMPSCLPTPASPGRNPQVPLRALLAAASCEEDYQELLGSRGAALEARRAVLLGIGCQSVIEYLHQKAEAGCVVRGGLCSPKHPSCSAFLEFHGFSRNGLLQIPAARQNIFPDFLMSHCLSSCFLKYVFEMRLFDFSGCAKACMPSGLLKTCSPKSAKVDQIWAMFWSNSGEFGRCGANSTKSGTNSTEFRVLPTTFGRFRQISGGFGKCWAISANFGRDRPNLARNRPRC